MSFMCKEYMENQQYDVLFRCREYMDNQHYAVCHSRVGNAWKIISMMFVILCENGTWTINTMLCVIYV